MAARKQHDAGARRVGRRFFYGGAALLALLLLAACLIAAAVRTETGTRLLWNAIVGVVPGVSGTLVAGTLADGISVSDFNYADAQRRVAADRIDTSWHLDLRPLTFTVNFVRVGHVDARLIPGNDEKTPPPRHLVLPLVIEVRELSIGAIDLHHEDQVTRIANIALAAQSDRIHHALDLQRAITPWGNAHVSARIDGSGPVALDVQGNLAGRLLDDPLAVDARIKGELEKFDALLDARGGKFTAHANVAATPFDRLPFTHAEITVEHLDPKKFSATLPRADFSVNATLAPSADAQGALSVAGPIAIRNATAGSLDRQLVPLVSAQAQVYLDRQRQQLTHLQVALAGGARAAGSASLQDGTGRLDVQVSALNLQALHSVLQKTALSGPITATQSGENQHVRLALSGEPYAMNVTASASITPATILLESARLESADARLEIKGKLGRDKEARYEVEGALTDFDPNRFIDLAAREAKAQRGPRRTRTSAKSAAPQRLPADIDINMDFSATGRLQPEFESQLRFAIHDSRYDRLPLSGKGTLALRGKQLLPSRAHLEIAGNAAELDGAFGRPQDSVRFRIDAPALDRLGIGASGRVQASGTLGGTVERPRLNAQWEATRFAFGEFGAEQAAGEAQLDALPGSSPDARANLKLNASGVRGGPFALTRLDANVDGTYSNHRLTFAAAGQLRGQPLNLRLAARGGLQSADAKGGSINSATAWHGTLEQLDNRGFPAFSLDSPLQLTAARDRVELGATKLTIEHATIALKELIWRPGLTRTAGELRGLNVGHLLALQKELTGKTPPVASSLVLHGRWDVSLAERASGFAELARESGDISVKSNGRDIDIGIDTLRLRADFEANRVRVDGAFGTARFGSLTANGTLGLIREQQQLTMGPQSALALRIQARIERLDNIASLATARVALAGSANADIAINGTLAKPVLGGTVLAENLALTLYDQGVRLDDGIARLSISNNAVELREVVFHGGDGTLRATGSIPLDRSNPGLTAAIVADRLQLIADPSRHLTLSGKALASNPAGQLKISGGFTVDHALFDLPDKSAPRLSDDVVILGPGAKKTRDKTVLRQPPPEPGLLPPLVDLKLALGNDFRFRGSGAALLLAGTLNITSGPAQSPQATGTVRVVNGVYEAFGAKLAIERGIISFQGPFDNPALNIIAMRREQDVQAGVHVTGNVREPRVDLVSEPNVPDEEKLSWLVFGRGTAASGGAGGQQAAGAALQAATTGLLNKLGSSKLASGVGLDRLSLGASNTGALAGQQVVTLGKEISNRLYVGYEQSLAGIGGVVKLTYELSRNWSLALLGGTSTGLDVLYSRRFDNIRGSRPPPENAAANP